jgi:DNA-binding NtrC family response regulator
MKSPRLLVIDDNVAMAKILRLSMEKQGYEAVVSYRGDEGLKLALEGDFDLVVSDLDMPGLSGLDLIQQLTASKPLLPLILITGHGSTDVAIEATKLGAFEYLEKPFQMDELTPLITRALANASRQEEMVHFKPLSADKSGVIGQSRIMQNLFKEVGRIADKPVTVLIHGSTGTGKELLARAIYQHSDRANKAFISVNCASIPETLLESEFFGHERGAFTGATERRIGRFEQANGGTLFLDEIGDISLGTQAKLLRVLQERTVQRLGSRDTISVDVRVIAATHQDLEAAVKEGKFREDLYYRLKVIALELPDLKDRREDIPSLVAYFLKLHGTKFNFPDTCISKPALQLLVDFPWPGNVRQLENVMRDALLQARGHPIQAELIEQILLKSRVPGNTLSKSLPDCISELLDQAVAGEMDNVQQVLQTLTERELYTQAYQRAGNNQLKAAKWLGISRPTMHEKLKSFGLL